jgi:hypothetical protein
MSLIILASHPYWRTFRPSVHSAASEWAKGPDDWVVVWRDFCGVRLSSHAPFEADRDEPLRFDSEFHWQLLQHVPNKAVDDERRRFLCRQAALPGSKTSAHPAPNGI